jgi:hypothetical protein
MAAPSHHDGRLVQGFEVSIVTAEDTLDELREQVRDAVRCHSEEGQAPKLIRLHFDREEIMAVRGCPVMGPR